MNPDMLGCDLACQCPTSWGLYYKSFTIIIYDHNDSAIVIYNNNDTGLYYIATIVN